MLKSPRINIVTLSKLLGLGLLFILSPACSTSSLEKPEDLINESTYIDLLVEFQLLKSLETIQGNTNADSLQQVIFERYEIDEDRFLRTHYYYQSQNEAQIKRIDQALERVRGEQGRSNKPKPDDDLN